MVPEQLQFAQSGADIVVHYGSPGDAAYPGNWNHGNITTVGVYRPTTRSFYLRTSNTSGAADGVFPYGNPGDIAQPGGPGILSLYRPSTGTWYFGQTLNRASGYDTITQVFGQRGDVPVAGPWGAYSCGVLHCFIGPPAAGVFRPSTGEWHLSQFVYTGSPEFVIKYGDPADLRVGLPAWQEER